MPADVRFCACAAGAKRASTPASTATHRKKPVNDNFISFNSFDLLLAGRCRPDVDITDAVADGDLRPHRRRQPHHIAENLLAQLAFGEQRPSAHAARLAVTEGDWM